MKLSIEVDTGNRKEVTDAIEVLKQFVMEEETGKSIPLGKLPDVFPTGTIRISGRPGSGKTTATMQLIAGYIKQIQEIGGERYRQMIGLAPNAPITILYYTNEGRSLAKALCHVLDSAGLNGNIRLNSDIVFNTIGVAISVRPVGSSTFQCMTLGRNVVMTCWDALTFDVRGSLQDALSYNDMRSRMQSRIGNNWCSVIVYNSTDGDLSISRNFDNLSQQQLAVYGVHGPAVDNKKPKTLVEYLGSIWGMDRRNERYNTYQVLDGMFACRTGTATDGKYLVTGSRATGKSTAMMLAGLWYCYFRSTQSNSDMRILYIGNQRASTLLDFAKPLYPRPFLRFDNSQVMDRLLQIDCIKATKDSHEGFDPPHQYDVVIVDTNDYNNVSPFVTNAIRHAKMFLQSIETDGGLKIERMR